ncbi:GxxExxY protein [Candidatus Oscillochloris fontis]|uniref:GxxExxY protein n=1 Tax=Candidatus Oscillochloris fontis TaxID=2496868 RepID=UPI001930F1E6|nr:GxxExxY protein [Candidatus Oscillochloris fontis]
MDHNVQRDPQTYAIIGAAMAVHRELGHGFLESVYQEALEIELTKQGIPFLREVSIPIYYKETLLKTTYRPDFICFDAVIVELKAIDTLSSKEEAQLLNYLKATKKQRGLLLNFGNKSLQHKRMVLNLNETS